MGNARISRPELDRLYRLLIESARDYAIFALDPKGRIVTWNLGAERLKGYTANEIIGQHFSIFYPPEDVAADKPGHELVIAEREGRVEDEGWRVRKDGSRFWASVFITALRDESGDLVGFGKVTRDLTERRNAELTLFESEELFRLLVQGVGDYGIFLLDPDGRVASWNKGAAIMQGYSAAEIIGRHFSTFYPLEDVARGKPAWELEQAIAHGRFEEEGWRIRKNGTRFWANVVITPVRRANGSLLGYAKVTRDLTERRASQERAIADARRIAEVEAANRAKSEFLTAMSHELRTPLNAIGGYTELLALGLRGPVTDAQRVDLERIQRSQQHLLRIINDLLNFSRIEAGQLTYDLRPVQLGSVIGAVAPMLVPQGIAKGVTVEQGTCGGDVVARADLAKVEQILLNLLSNAVKFTDSGGHITISCAATEHYASVSVHDTGVGIPADKLEAIFEPFVQVGRSLTTSHEGTGLGLAISRDLARAMGGDIVVESREREGSTFTLRLPRG